MTNEKLDGIALATQIACDHIVKIAAERDALKALCVELMASVADKSGLTPDEEVLLTRALRILK